MTRKINILEGEDWDLRPDELPGYDKFHHRERSIRHQPNHLRHPIEKPFILSEIRIPEKQKKYIKRDGRR
jgi:hypothetical protein